MKRFLIAIVVLAVLGISVSSYALWQHYAPLGSAFCNLGETFSCDLVNKSAFSEVFGIPVALIGILGYAGIAALSVAARTAISPPLLEGERLPADSASVATSAKEAALAKAGEGVRAQASNVQRKAPLGWLLAFSLLGFLFSAYLTYIEFFVIGAVCILCVISQALILAITVLTAVVWKRCQPLVP